MLNWEPGKLIYCFGNANRFNLMNINLTTSNKIVHALPLIQSSLTTGKIHLHKVIHCNTICKNCAEKEHRECTAFYVERKGK